MRSGATPHMRTTLARDKRSRASGKFYSPPPGPNPMLRSLRISVFLLSAILLLPACSATKQIADHRDALTAALGPDVAVDTKRDVLATQLVAMMHQAVDRLDPRRGGKFVRQYIATNDDVLGQLYGEIEAEQAGWSDAQRVLFAAQVVRKPYAKDALALAPRFVRRYRQIQGVVNLTDKLKGAALGRLGGQ